MHSAPTVSYPVGRSRFAAGLLLLAWLAAAAAIGLWWAQVQAPAWRVAAAGMLLGGTGLYAAWTWWHGPVGTLAWDGQAWHWRVPGGMEAGEPTVSLDLQRWLLLRLDTDQRRLWLWLEGARRAERWGDLRRALYSRARAPQDQLPRQP